MLNSVTIAAPILLPLMSFGIVIYLIVRGGSAAATRLSRANSAR
ncbi:hypothetical protein [Rhodoplanes sp.]|nr:hypothetical protein [Rhodoplanes sp.]